MERELGRSGREGTRTATRRQEGGEPESRQLGPREAWLPARELGPFDLLRRTTQEMDRLFNFGFGGSPGTTVRWPALEVFDREDKLVVRVELPGMKREEVRVRVVGDTLVIEGERRSENAGRSEGLHRSEWTYGRFYREILIPTDIVEAAALTARMQHGVLEITMPYREERRPREIEVTIDEGDTSQEPTAAREAKTRH